MESCKQKNKVISGLIQLEQQVEKLSISIDGLVSVLDVVSIPSEDEVKSCISSEKPIQSPVNEMIDKLLNYVQNLDEKVVDLKEDLDF